MLFLCPIWFLEVGGGKTPVLWFIHLLQNLFHYFNRINRMSGCHSTSTSLESKEMLRHIYQPIKVAQKWVSPPTQKWKKKSHTEILFLEPTLRLRSFQSLLYRHIINLTLLVIIRLKSKKSPRPSWWATQIASNLLRGKMRIRCLGHCKYF